MKTLHLNVHRKWFDLIKSGQKLEEYRDLTPYWAKNRLIWNHDPCIISDLGDELYINVLLNYNGYRSRKEVLDRMLSEFAHYDTITFSNGYRKDRDQFVIECLDISIGQGVPEWGAVPGKEYFVIHLGEIIK